MTTDPRHLYDKVANDIGQDLISSALIGVMIAAGILIALGLITIIVSLF